MKFNVDSSISDKDVFLISKSKKINYLEAGVRIDKAANWLSNKGAKSGSKVALSLSNDWDTATLFIALLKLGATTILIDPRFKRSKSLATIERVQPDIVIADEALIKNWEEVSCSTVGLGEGVKKSTLSKLLGKKKESVNERNSLDDQLAEIPGFVDYIDVDENSIAYILFTSGSSAQPKGVKISYRNLFVHLKTLKRVYELGSVSNMLNILPIYHTDGIIQGPILTYFVGCTLVRPFDFEIGKVQELFDGIYKYRISHFLTVPTMLDILLKFSAGYEDSFKTDDFRYIISSASILEKEVWNAFESKFDVSITNVYGLTETVAGGLFCGPSELTKRIGSIGKPIDCEVKLINEQGDEVTTSNEVGELFMRGEHIAKEYLGTRYIPNEEGWFATGDLSYRDCDDFYYIHGRKSNIIISGGVNISPEEIEEVIKFHSEVTDCCAFGVYDSTWGEKLEVALVLVNTKNDDLRTIMDYCHEQLEVNKLPTKFHVIENIPRTLSGKIDRKRLISLVRSDDGSENGDINVLETIQQISSEIFKIDTQKLGIYEPSKSIDGWTSLNHLDLIVTIEKRYSIKFSTSEIMIIGCLSDVVELVENKIPKTQNG